MSYELLRVFAEEAKTSDLGQYKKKPALHISVPGVVGTFERKTDDKGSFFEIRVIGTGENENYPKGHDIKIATVRESKDSTNWTLADNDLTLGGGKQIIGFGVHETEISSKTKPRGVSAFLLRDNAYPDHKILNLSVAFIRGGSVEFMEGPKLCVPKSVQDDPAYQAAAKTNYGNLDICV